jgi:pimeloyl-ACP methyl ester carboxylesterase
MATFVLVHGGWDGGWAWRAVADGLRAAGNTVFTPTLTGSGERAHLASPNIDLDTHIQDIVHVLAYEDLREVVLVASSSGGMVITGVAERVPERLRQLIYLDAFVPRDGESLLAIVGSELAHGFIAAAQAYGDGWRVPHNPPGADRRTDFLLRCAQTPVSVSNPAAAQLKHAYLHCTAKAPDDVLKPIMERMAARARDQGWPVHEAPLSHWPLLDAPREVARELLALAAGAATRPGTSPQQNERPASA